MYRLNTKIRLTMLCLSGFELYSRWVPLTMLHGAKSLTGFKVCATTPNNPQQHTTGCANLRNEFDERDTV